MNPTVLRSKAIGAAVALLLTAIVMFVPGAAAEGIGAVTVTIESDPELEGGRLLPETGVAQLTVKAAVTVNAAGACIQQIELTYTVLNAPTYAAVLLNPSSQSISIGDDGEPGTPDLPTTGAGSQTYDAVPVTMVVSTRRDAPAFEDGRYEIEVLAKAGQVSGEDGSACNLGERKGIGATTIKNDYLPVTVLNPTILYMKSGQNKKLVVPVEVINNGNGPTRVSLEAIQSGKDKLDAISVGPEMRLESRATRGAGAVYKSVRSIEVQTPHGNGYTNSIYQFQVRFKSGFDGSASGSLVTDDQVLTFSVQVQGVYVPGFDPTILLGALGVGLLMMRRRGGGAA